MSFRNHLKPITDKIDNITELQIELCEMVYNEAWNEAIEAAIMKLQKDFIAPEVVIKIIREIKK